MSSTIISAFMPVVPLLGESSVLLQAIEEENPGGHPAFVSGGRLVDQTLADQPVGVDLIHFSQSIIIWFHFYTYS